MLLLLLIKLVVVYIILSTYPRSVINLAIKFVKLLPAKFARATACFSTRPSYIGMIAVTSSPKKEIHVSVSKCHT